MKTLYTIIFCIFMGLNFAAQANDKIGVVAVVNNNAITNLDLINKLKLTMISAGIKSTPENIARLKPQVLQDLINEYLQLEEADNSGIKITDEEISEAMTSLEKQNKMPAGGLRKLLAQNSIPVEVLQNQIKANIAWAGIQSTKLGRKVKVDDEEITTFLRSQVISDEKNEYFLHEIVLPFDDEKSESIALGKVQEIQDKLAKGQKFEKLAKKYSAAATAPNGGVIGWLEDKKIPLDIAAFVTKLAPNQVSKPIRSIEGYFLVKYSDKKTIKANFEKAIIDLKKFYVPITSDKNFAGKVQKLEALNNNYEACVNGKKYASKNGVNFLDIGQNGVAKLNPAVKSVIYNLEIGEFSKVAPIKGKASVYLICEKIEEAYYPELDPAEREKAKNVLQYKKLQLQSRKYMRDLRAKNNIEIR